jgi:hypothetical protein
MSPVSTILRSPTLPVVGIIILVFAIIGGVLFLRGTAAEPRINDHWHAVYQVAVCGEVLPPFPASDGTPGIHTHGDGLIHIHPNSSDDEGKNANLDRFFDGVGVTFSEDVLRLPDGREFHDGDVCPDGQSGRLVLLVGETSNLADPGLCQGYAENQNYERYVPKQDDCVLVQFGV